MSLVYLAGPVDAVSAEDARGWRTDASALLVPHGIATFSPPHAFESDPTLLDEDTCEKIVEINDAALRTADACLAYVGKASYGTPLEIQLCRMANKPVFVFGLSEYSIYRHRFDGWSGSHELPTELVDQLITELRSGRPIR